MWCRRGFHQKHQVEWRHGKTGWTAWSKGTWLRSTPPVGHKEKNDEIYCYSSCVWISWGALFHFKNLPCKAAELEKWKLLVVQLIMNSVTVLWHHSYSTVQHNDLVSLSPEATWPQHGWVQHTWSVLFPSLSELILHCAIESQHTSAQSWYNPLNKKWTRKDTVPDTAMYYGFVILWSNFRPSFSLCNTSKHLVTAERKRIYALFFSAVTKCLLVLVKSNGPSTEPCGTP